MRRYFQSAQERGAATRKRRRLRGALGVGNLTPWQFVLGRRDDALEYLLEECDLPSWVETGLLDVVVRRGRGTWDVRERVEVDREGEVVSREYVWCEFEVSIKWRGRLTGEFVKVEWSEEGEFESLCHYDKSVVKALFERLVVPEESGMVLEEDL